SRAVRPPHPCPCRNNCSWSVPLFRRRLGLAQKSREPGRVLVPRRAGVRAFLRRFRLRGVAFEAIDLDRRVTMAGAAEMVGAGEGDRFSVGALDRVTGDAAGQTILWRPYPLMH